MKSPASWVVTLVVFFIGCAALLVLEHRLRAPSVVSENLSGRYHLTVLQSEDDKRQIYRIDSWTGKVERLEHIRLPVNIGGYVGADGWETIDKSIGAAKAEAFAMKKQMDGGK